MTGLVNIIKKIEDDSDKLCAGIILSAEQDAEKTREKARTEGKEMAKNILQRAHSQAEANYKRACSSAQMSSSKAMLSLKIELINKVIEDAATALESLSDAEYFASLEALARNYARPNSNGIMQISDVDKQRMPADFEVNLNNILSKQGASLRIETVQKNLGGGFVLVYGDVQQNCTFSALIDAMRDELKDKINQELFF